MNTIQYYTIYAIRWYFIMLDAMLSVLSGVARKCWIDSSFKPVFYFLINYWM